ncbi:MAG: hypothetical protein O2831_06745 [Bacteroidetes bacterium]|nr:hypothetical protein [Bacteroidota bacterium]
MEKEMLIIGKLKQGEGMLERFLEFFNSEEVKEERKKVANTEKTVFSILPDKSGFLMKASVFNFEGIKDLLNGNNPVINTPEYHEVIDFFKLYEINEININE